MNYSYVRNNFSLELKFSFKIYTFKLFLIKFFKLNIHFSIINLINLLNFFNKLKFNINPQLIMNLKLKKQFNTIRYIKFNNLKLKKWLFIWWFYVITFYNFTSSIFFNWKTPWINFKISKQPYSRVSYDLDFFKLFI